MKKSSLMTSIALVLMLVLASAPMASAQGPTQPPINTDELYVGTIGWGPRDADPHVSYDTGSGELIFNSYENLIAMGAPVTNEWGTWDVHEQYWEFHPKLATNVPDRVEVTQDFVNTTFLNVTDPACTWLEPVPPVAGWTYHIYGWVDNNPLPPELSECDVLYITEYYLGEPVTCRTWQVIGVEIVGSVVTLHLHRWYYDFNIRTDPVVYFVNETDHIVDTMDIIDVEYSLERALVRDPQSSLVAWMLYLITMDQHGSYHWDTGDPDDAWCLSYLIEDAFEIISTDPPVFRINIGIDFPDIAFKQIIAQSWAAIMSKEFSISIDDWDGELFTDTDMDGFPDWFTKVRYVEPTPYNAGWRYVGTGPYRVSVVDDVNKIVILERNTHYWMGWPAPGRHAAPGTTGYLDKVFIYYIKDWAPRRDAFLASQLDICAVPRAYMSELLDPADPAKMTPILPQIKTIKNIYPGLSCDATHYTFLLRSEGNTYIGTGNLEGGLGIPLNFFNYTDIRKAFSYAFNRSKYLKEAWMGEASCRETPLISGLVPDYYSKGPDPPYTYDIDYSKAKAHLKAAVMNSTGGSEGIVDSVWNWGFTLDVAYNTGNDQRMIACNYIRDFFLNMSGDAERSGKPPFVVNIREVDWPTYLYGALIYRHNPIWAIGWLSDYADADNWAGAYIHSYICFAYFQRYWVDLGWTTTGPRTGLDKDQLVSLAVKTPDGPERAEMYADLDDIYLEDCPSMPLAEPFGRAWRKYWVKGWYYNGLYPAMYYYHLYKYDTCYADVTGPTPGVPDGVTNMRDIGYIAAHFGAKAPDPALPDPYADKRWAPGTYGYGGCDVYGDRKIDMRDIGFACGHFLHANNTGTP